MAPKLLIIDDYLDTADCLAALFGREGFICEKAADVREAVEKFNAACDAGSPCYDAVVMDVDLPSASGLKLLEAIRAVHESLPIFFLTAYDNDLLRLRAREGHADVDVKPLVESEAFIEKVGKAAREHQASKVPVAHARVIVPEIVEQMIAHSAASKC